MYTIFTLWIINIKAQLFLDQLPILLVLLSDASDDLWTASVSYDAKQMIFFTNMWYIGYFLF